MSACTPSRINQEGNPEALNPRNGNYGRGLGDYFGYRELLRGVARRGATARASSSTTASRRRGRDRGRRRQRVVVVTGGGGGIGAAIAEELGRQGAFVVTMDPLVTLDGSEQLPAPEETTAGRIVAAGGSARASSVSVTDGDAVRDLFDELVDEHGRLDAVINVAGITRPTSFATGSEEDWRGVLAVHLDGYLNVLGAALPIMAAAGHGHILGVTSGSGWRPADTGAYGCAKRAVAALTWQLGRRAPPGVVVNAMSPIAVTRMVTAALGRAPARRRWRRRRARRPPAGSRSARCPSPSELGPLGAHLVGDDFSWCSGQVLFAGGSEVAVIDEPRLLEVVRTDDVAVAGRTCSRRSPPARWRRPRPSQASSGGEQPAVRVDLRRAGADDLPAAAAVRSCAVVTDRPERRRAPSPPPSRPAASTCHRRSSRAPARGFAGAAAALASTAEQVGPLDAVVVALGGAGPAADAASDVGAGARRARRHRRRHPRRRRLGPGRRRPRRRAPTARSGW